jgi:hypothetical protein
VLGLQHANRSAELARELLDVIVKRITVREFLLNDFDFRS